MPRRTVHDLVAEARAEIEELTPAQVQAELTAGRATVVDIRDFRERIEKGSIPGAVSAPRGMLEFWFDPESPYHKDRYTPDQRYIFYCGSGWRSALATKVIGEIGYDDVAHLESGFSGWVEAGMVVEDVASTSPWVRRGS
ncbi:rhodanese-like domain-containing protein [Euzebya tangerina]|uniref:rhodanese-like domain-containing protein n=1 Tax=Euzebya tangerina TaxID=591198 RepID=UPI000E319885|nr:rhodanese-like domain-containing protein [Euzebya tangerina]